MFHYMFTVLATDLSIDMFFLGVIAHIWTSMKLFDTAPQIFKGGSCVKVRAGAVAMVEFWMASRREEKKESASFNVMRLLDDNPEITTRGVAQAVGISNGSAYYVIKALVEKGFVKLESFNNNPRKGQYVYLLTPKGIREKSLLTHRFIKRKRKEFEELRAEIKALEEEMSDSGIDTLKQESKSI